MNEVLIQPAGYDTVRKAVDIVFDRFPLDIKGKKVLIKPNVLRSSGAHEGIVTHPSVLKAVVEKVREMGPSSITVGDNPGLINYGENEECFIKTGLMDAAGGFYRNIGDDSVKVDFNPDFMSSVSISRQVLEADIIISLPKFKTHGLTVLTGAIKNSYGFLPGAQKARLHKAAGSQDRFHELIVEIFRIRVPDLFIVDAIVGMEGNGPASPDLREIGLIIASPNAVAVDSVMARMMGVDPGKLRFLRMAKDAGLGDYDPESITIIGRFEKLQGFKLPPMDGGSILNNRQMQEAIGKRSALRARANPETCTSCGSCIEHCPVSALSMAVKIPLVDPSLCISCFCCQEICPEKAMTLAPLPA